jgi:hypothetical protein
MISRNANCIQIPNFLRYLQEQRTVKITSWGFKGTTMKGTARNNNYICSVERRAFDLEISLVTFHTFFIPLSFSLIMYFSCAYCPHCDNVS